jgi:hypothetical protein
MLPAINYYKLKNGEARGLKYPPLPKILQETLNQCVKRYGQDSYEFIALAEDIVFIEDKWTRMYINW